jgi:hypothetical protein
MPSEASQAAAWDRRAGMSMDCAGVPPVAGRRRRQSVTTAALSDPDVHAHHEAKEGLRSGRSAGDVAMRGASATRDQEASSGQLMGPLGGFDAATMRFDGAWLRRAILARGWTIPEFAEAARPPLSVETVYNALRGRTLSQHTVLRMYAALRLRQPIAVVE